MWWPHTETLTLQTTRSSTKLHSFEVKPVKKLSQDPPWFRSPIKLSVTATGHHQEKNGSTTHWVFPSEIWIHTFTVTKQVEARMVKGHT
jgi:hypothetical protein